MTLAQFPVLPGIGWKISRILVTNTKILTADSGVEYRSQTWSYPRRKFTIPVSFLRQYGSFVEQAALEGFILSAAGMFANWFYDDPFDDTATNQSIGVGNAAQLAFPLVRTYGGFTEPIFYCASVQNVYLNGAVQASGYSLTQTGPYGNDTITFATPPGNGVAVTADFKFYYVCRLQNDENEMINDFSGLWSMKSIDFYSVK